MKQKKLESLFEENKINKLSWEGKCHDCGKDILVKADWTEDSIVISNGAVYEVQLHDGKVKVFLKCQKCYDAFPELTKFQPCDVYSRTVGYYRPINCMNGAKQEEYKMRTNFNLDAKIASLKHCD